MSSSGQQPTNFKNDQSKAKQPSFQIPPHNPYSSDYEDDPSQSAIANFTPFLQSAYISNGVPYNSLGEPDFIPEAAEYVSNEDEVIPSDIQAEFNKNDETIANERWNDNGVDESVFSEDVQNAFNSYENEYSKHWKPNEPTTDLYDDEEEEDIFEQMHECMRFMSHEYSIAAMPQDFSLSTELNPDAAEFLPVWSMPGTSTDNNSNIPS